MSSQVFPISLISLFAVHRKVFFGQLLLRFPPGAVQCRAVFAMEASWWVTCPIRLQRLLIRMVAIGLVIEYEQGSISSWRAVPFNSFVVSMFPMKVKSDRAGFSFLDLILLIQASFDRLIMNYCDKNQPDTLNISFKSLYMNPDLNSLLTYKLNLEQRVVLAAEISWDRNKTTITYYSAHFLGSR